jgi:hypothetical protein
MHMTIVAIELDNGEDEVVRLVKRIQDFVLGDGYRSGARQAALDLDEAKPAGSRHSAFNVVAELFGLAIGGHKTKITFDLHDNDTGLRGRCLGVFRKRGRPNGTFPSHHGQQPSRDHEQAT